MITAATLELPDGRTLGWAEWGDPEGRPVLYCHGTPGSRLEHPVGEKALDGVRLIAVDRPGFGFSAAQPQRRLVDWPLDVTVLVDHLGLERFHVHGVSGGGPYALACARDLPERVQGAAVVCSGAPSDRVDIFDGMSESNHMVFGAARDDPSQLAEMLEAMRAALEGSMNQPPVILDDLCAADQACMADPSFAAMLASELREAFRQGTAGPVDDMVLFVSPWGFNPEDITVHVVVAHGDLDVNVPVACGEWLAGTIPSARFLRYADDGHFSLAARSHEVLAVLLGGD
jgi:pimeloyl-ACP methyl ester carboxylesterase